MTKPIIVKKKLCIDFGQIFPSSVLNHQNTQAK